MAVHEHLCHFQVCLKLGKWDKKKKPLILLATFFWGGGGDNPFIFLMNIGTSEWNIYTYEALLVKLGQRFGSLRQHNEMIGSV